MTLPRPVLIALLGLALCAAAFLATRNANDTGGAVTTTPPVAQTRNATPAVKQPAKPAEKRGSGKGHDKATPTDSKPSVKAATPPAVDVKPDTPPKVAVKPAPSSKVAKVLPAIKALGRGDVVVYFFTRKGAADDTGSAEAVKSLRGEKHVSVFTVGFSDLEAFRPVLNGAGVSQFPSIVVVHGGHPGRLLEGYVDAATLRQTVADARR
jgi:hypothetical protein